MPPPRAETGREEPARRIRVERLFALFNAGAFDTMLESYADGVKYATSMLPGLESDWAVGKAGYSLHLHRFHELYAPVVIEDIFGDDERTNIHIRLRDGTAAMFCVEIDENKRVRQVYVFRT